MRSSKRLFLFSCSLFLTAQLLSEAPTLPLLEEKKEEFVINLKDPVFSHGVLMTTQGGVITAPGLRIQAKHIEYTNKIENGNPVQRIVAEGDLMMEYADRAFVGNRLEYDFIAKTGTLWEGKTFVNIWFLGGERITLESDGTFLIYNAYVTTSESQDHTWELNTGLLKITKNHLLSADNISFRFFKTPVFWLPSFKSNLRWLRDPPIRYKVRWDRGLGPRLSMRYRVYSWEDFNLFFRFDYRIKRGPGAALESEYYSKDERTTFLTKSYGAYDKEFTAEPGNKRYRLQGLYQTSSQDDRTNLYIAYDKLSDDKMPSDFKSDDFEVNTQRRTIFHLQHQESDAFATFRFQPRINRFQSLNQELPLLLVGLRPVQLGSSGIISQNRVNGGFLNYVFATSLRDFLPNRHAVRFEANHQFYRPIPLGPVTVTPTGGIIGIFYNNNPERRTVGQATFTYGGEARMTLDKEFSRYKHRFEPYYIYTGLSRPKAAIDQHYIFSLDDGIARLDMMRIGMRNSLFSRYNFSLLPTLALDLYTYGYLKADSFRDSFPKYYADVEWLRPSYAIRAGVAWNQDQTRIDYTNVRADVTVSEDFAFGVEYRHRSKFDWRKAVHDNFIVDVARSLDNLLDSPMSDRRDTLLTRWHARLTPRVTLHLQSHHGWHRLGEPPYNSGKLDLSFLMASSWLFRTTLQYYPANGLSVGATISLVK